MDEFFRSTRVAFAENRQGADIALGVVLALVVLWFLVQAVGALKQRRAVRGEVDGLAARSHLGEDLPALVEELAKAGRVEPLQVLTELQTFEAASARLLERVSVDPDGALAVTTGQRLRRLREALGFQRAKPTAPLRSSRELPVGAPVRVAGVLGRIERVTELDFTVELDGAPGIEPGTAVAVAFVRAREARYQLRCTVLAVDEGVPLGASDARWAVRLTHDEAPLRVQKREFVRVAASGGVEARRAAGRGESERPTIVDRGELIDASGGGLCCLFTVALPPGSIASTSFELGGQRFEGLRAQVLSSTAQEGGFQVRFAFAGLPESVVERLVAVITRLSSGAKADKEGAADGGRRSG